MKTLDKIFKYKIKIWFVLIYANTVCLDALAMKRVTQLKHVPEKRIKIQNENQRSHAIPITPSNTPTESNTPVILPLLEIIALQFDCKYYGQDQCNYSFTSKHEEWAHILEYHDIVAAFDE